MSQKVFSKDAEPTNVEQIDILSNIDESKSASIIGGFAGMTYTESIMSDTIKVKVSFIDSGDSLEDKSITEALPLVGQEQVRLKFSDNNENTLKVVLYVNKITPNSDRTQESMITLDLVSKEFIMNEKKRVNQRFDGKVSDHIKKLLTDSNYLGTDKTVDIEQTQNLYNFEYFDHFNHFEYFDYFENFEYFYHLDHFRYFENFEYLYNFIYF